MDVCIDLCMCVQALMGVCVCVCVCVQCALGSVTSHISEICSKNISSNVKESCHNCHSLDKA